MMTVTVEIKANPEQTTPAVFGEVAIAVSDLLESAFAEVEGAFIPAFSIVKIEDIGE